MNDFFDMNGLIRNKSSEKSREIIVTSTCSLRYILKQIVIISNF